MSPDRQVMVPVPPGRSEVELSYPGPLAARRAFWACVACWAAFWAWRALGSRVPARPWALVAAPARWAWRNRWLSLAAAAAAALAAHRIAGRAAGERDAGAVGPALVEFQLPYGKKDINEPLLATGHATAGVVIFAHIIDERHISIGADVWGSLFQSDPVEVDFSRPHRLVVSDGALYPLSNPRLKALPPDEVERLRSELVVELDGRVVMRQAANCYESTIPEVLAGRTSFGSLTAPEFRGTILTFARLPIPQVIMLPASQHARMRVRFPKDRGGASEPILSASAGPDTCLCAATYLSDGELRLSLIANGRPPLASRSVRYDPSTVHELDFWPSTDGRDAASLALSCTFDGVRVFGSDTAIGVDRVPILKSGLNGPQAPGVEARFTGPQMDLVLLSDHALPEGARDWGAGELVVSFPLGKTGRHEPLLTTGTSGSGDFVYVVYEDLAHVRLGFDHWGGSSGLLSDPIEVDYRVPHEIWISMAPLYPDLPGDAAWQGAHPGELGRLRSRVAVALDGRTVVSLTAATYPCAPGQVTFFENRIGGSTADARFTGIAHFLKRIAPSPSFP
jgi:hypothetical protein